MLDSNLKFLADENIPLDVVNILKKDGINIISITEIDLGLEDEAILKLADKEDMVIITFDKDFGELVFKAKKKSKGIILLQFHPQTVGYIVSVLKNVLKLSINFNKSFLVVETGRVRVIPLDKI